MHIVSRRPELVAEDVGAAWRTDVPAQADSKAFLRISRREGEAVIFAKGDEWMLAHAGLRAVIAINDQHYRGSRALGPDAMLQHSVRFRSGRKRAFGDVEGDIYPGDAPHIDLQVKGGRAGRLKRMPPEALTYSVGYGRYEQGDLIAPGTTRFYELEHDFETNEEFRDMSEAVGNAVPWQPNNDALTAAGPMQVHSRPPLDFRHPNFYAHDLVQPVPSDIPATYRAI